MRAWLDTVLSVLLAPVCAACAAPLAQPTRGCVCPACWAAIVHESPPVCAQCGAPLPSAVPSLLCCASCIRTRPRVSRARAIGPHDGALRAIVHALKYDQRRSLARGLARLMVATDPAIVAGCDAAVPVPLHGARLRSRGFNQAHDLACHVGLPVVRALRRTRHTHTQTTLPAGERHANVAGAFAPTRAAARLRGTTVLLIDDVRTTGATLEACAVVLREAGVCEVRALTAARVASPDA